MSNSIKDIILSSRVGKIGGLAFAVYALIWGIVEPLGLKWIEDHKAFWRIILPVLAGLVTAVLSIRLSSLVLDKIDADGPDRTLQESYSSTGNPQVNVLQDGHLGNVVNIKGQYEKDELDWGIKSSAQKAGELELIFKHNGLFYFYLRVVMVSRNGGAPTIRWIRFDNSMATPERYKGDPHEMGIHYESDPLGSYNKATIDIIEAVKNTYGQAGWEYKKSMIFRVRRYDGAIKNVYFKK